MWLVTQERTQTTQTPDLLEPSYIDLDGLVGDLGKRVVARPGKLFGQPFLAEEPIAPEERKTALAVSGGGAAGAYSAGSMEALTARLRRAEVPIDILVGTSSGALNCYGLFLELLGKHNPKLCRDPKMQQPYSTFIASVWSYLGRHPQVAEWVVGRRAWMIGLGTRGLTPMRRWGLAVVALLLLCVLNPFLFVGLFVVLDAEGWLPGFVTNDPAWRLFALGGVSFLGLVAMIAVAVRTFWRSLFRDGPLLRLLANSVEGGDLSGPSFPGMGQTEDHARVVSRKLVREWYRRSDELPELIITATDITVGRECLFTLVRPETYRRLIERGWMAVQLDSEDDAARVYRDVPGALFTLPENLLRCVVSSTAVPSAFPAQEIGMYGANVRRDVRHRFFDGGVINNSPIHLAIDAGATHIVSLELEALKAGDPLDADDKGRGYNLLEAGVTTFTALLERASQRDIRRTVTWNRFLVEHPEAMTTPSLMQRLFHARREEKRIIHLYRIAPAERELGTVEFDGRWEDGVRVATVRDVLRRGVVDLKGPHIWRATLQSTPLPEGGEGKAPPK